MRRGTGPGLPKSCAIRTLTVRFAQDFGLVVRNSQRGAHCQVVFSRNILDLFARQYGVASRTQLIDDFDIPPWKIARTLKSGVFTEVVPGVVRVSSSRETFRMRCMALQLRASGVGFISGWSAGRLRGLRLLPDEPIHFTSPVGPGRRNPPWAHVHRTAWYDADLDRETLDDGLVVAAPMRMLFGLAAAFNQFRFERAAEDAWHRKLITPHEAAHYLEQHRCRGKDGVAIIEQWLEKAIFQDRPAQSNLERSLLEALEEIALPTPVRQHPLILPSGEAVHLDIAWPDIRLGIEPGASWWHGGDLAQRKDQARDRACGEIGWQIVRFDESMRDDIAASARQVRRIHRRRTLDLQNLARSER